MLDDVDDGARIGIWAALGVVALLLFGLVGALVVRQTAAQASAAPQAGARAPAAPAVPAALAAPAAPAAMSGAPAGGDVELVDAPLVGEFAGAIYFAVGRAELPADAPPAIQAIRAKAEILRNHRLMLSGFHDSSGDPARNAELAQERAKAVRAALVAAGVDAARIQLRKPASTVGGGDPQEARRVEVRLVRVE
jgi:outer membrane protein OmpA-like peptidoglycan-associated protein